MAGRGSLAGLLAYGDANAIVMEVANEVLPVPADAQYILQNTKGVAGFFGASSIKRLPTGRGIKAQTEEFKGVTF